MPAPRELEVRATAQTRAFDEVSRRILRRQPVKSEFHLIIYIYGFEGKLTVHLEFIFVINLVESLIRASVHVLLEPVTPNSFWKENDMGENLHKDQMKDRLVATESRLELLLSFPVDQSDLVLK